MILQRFVANSARHQLGAVGHPKADAIEQHEEFVRVAFALFKPTS
jgi:hypothetical protein